MANVLFSRSTWYRTDAWYPKLLGSAWTVWVLSVVTLIWVSSLYRYDIPSVLVYVVSAIGSMFYLPYTLLYLMGMVGLYLGQDTPLNPGSFKRAIWRRELVAAALAALTVMASTDWAGRQVVSDEVVQRCTKGLSSEGVTALAELVKGTGASTTNKEFRAACQAVLRSHALKREYRPNSLSELLTSDDANQPAQKLSAP